jgi:hypothetical protein
VPFQDRTSSIDSASRVELRTGIGEAYFERAFEMVDQAIPNPSGTIALRYYSLPLKGIHRMIPEEVRRKTLHRKKKPSSKVEETFGRNKTSLIDDTA